MFRFRVANQRLPDSHPRRERERERPPRRSSRGATPGRKPGSRQVPGWLWLVAGLGGGMLITSLIKLSTAPEPAAVAAPAPIVAPVKPAKPAAAEPKVVVVEEEADSTPTDAEAEPATRFDFYTLLPEREVIVPDREPDTPARSTLPATAAATSNSAAPKAATTAAAPVESGEYYLLQAGSFRGGAEAERRRAQIAALGLQARVETVRAGSDTWYRVHAGPFTARDQLAAARDRLSAEGIETLQLRKKR